MRHVPVKLGARVPLPVRNPLGASTIAACFRDRRQFGPPPSTRGPHVPRFLHPVAAAFALIVACGPPAFAAADPAHPDTLADSTWVDRWTLKNGIDVNVRHIPSGNAVAVIVAYRVGRNLDPPGQEGLADLLAEVLLTAPAGDIPERSRQEMGDLRPRGWNLQVTPRFTLLSELAPPDRFPGLLRQVATRMRGVTVTDTGLAGSQRVVGRDLADRYLGTPQLMLIHQLHELAAGVSDEAILRRASGRTLQDVTVRGVSERLHELYVPANAVLAMAGNFQGVDLRSLVASLFEDIPAGTPVREPPRPVLKAGARTVRTPNLQYPVGIAGVISPALEDSLHPDFYFNALIIGRYCEQQWGKAPQPLPSRFRYPIMADPQLVEFFPPVGADETDADQLGVILQDAVEALSVSIVDPAILEELRINHVWILGGPMTPSLLARMREHTGTLHTLASTLAVRALWGSDDFWARYRARFMNPHGTRGERWGSYFQAPDHIVRLLMVPSRR